MFLIGAGKLDHYAQFHDPRPTCNSYNSGAMNTITGFVCTLVFCAVIAGSPSLFGQSSPKSEAQQVPAMDGGAGPCSLELTINGPDGKPVYAAKVKVHIAYGFGGFHRLDLEAGTNWDGKLKFTGLPARVRRPPLEFNASKDDLQGVATYDPSAECQGKHDLTLSKAKNTQ